MNAISQNRVKTALYSGILAAVAVCAGYGQTQVNLATQGRDVDFSNAPSTRPVKTGTALPATCSAGDLFFKTNAPQGQNLYGCPAVNTWALLVGAQSLSFYQTIESNATALTQRPGVNFSTAFSTTDDSTSLVTDIDLAAVNSNVGTFGSASQVPVITVNAHGLITGVSTAAISGGGSGSAAAWGAITGTLSSQTDLENALNGKQATGNYIAALTGDVTASGPGSASATLATVNSEPGQCGDATHSCQVTTDAKGRVTAQTQVAISGGGGGSGTAAWGAITGTLSSQTDLENALNGKQATGNYLTGLIGDGTAAGPGSPALTLATVNSEPGQCGDATHVCEVTTDGKGRVTAQTPVTITAGALAWGAITGTLSSQTDLENALNGKQATGNYLTALTGDVTAAGPGSASATLATVNSGAGQCGDATHVCEVTTDAKGRVTAQTPVTITAGGTGTVTHTTGALTAGRIVLGNGSGDVAIGDLTGDITTSGSATTTLATVNTEPGQCGDATHSCQVTVDGKGRVTAQTQVAISGGGGGSGTAAWGAITGTLSTQTDLENALNGKQATGNYLTGLIGDGTAAGPGSPTLTLATVNTVPGPCGDATHVCQVTTDSKGRVTTQAPVSITASAAAWGAITGTLSTQTDLENALNGKQATGNYLTALTGDVTASGPGSASATLATVNSGAGHCGDATHVCEVTTDAKGRVTAQTPVTITASAAAWGAITGTLSTQTDLENALNGKQATGNYLTGLIGDGTASGPGSPTLTLATVNTVPGQCGDATHVCQVTTDGKGRVTTQAPVSITASAVAWGAITGTLSTQTDLENALNGKQATGNYLTALTGDVTASGPGSAPATLATVNSGAGQCGDGTHVCQVTTDAKGRVTAQTPVTISAGGGGTVTHVTGTLTAGRIILGNGSGDITTGDLTGDISTSGSAAATLATVNTAPGQCGDATHVCQVTTDGKGRVTAQTPVTITAAGSAPAWGAITGTLSSQTDLASALNGKQATGNYLTGLTGDGTAAGAGSAALTLATVNSGSGQCGDASHICQVTTNGKGLVTSQTAVAIAGGNGNATSIQGTAISSSAPSNLQVLQFQAASNSYVPASMSGGGAGNWGAGAFAAIPATCTPGSGVYVYFATDQPAGQQEYQCSASNIWTQVINIGPSGALAMVNGSLDIVTGVVPRLPNTNTFTGANTFNGPVFQIGGTSTDPSCTQISDIGKIWINTASAANTAYEVCLSVSSTVRWVVK